MINEKSAVFLALFMVACLALLSSNEYFTGSETNKPIQMDALKEASNNSDDESSMDSDEDSNMESEAESDDDSEVESIDQSEDSDDSEESVDSVDSNDSELLKVNQEQKVRGVQSNTSQQQEVSPDLVKEINNNAQKKIQGNNLEPVKQKGHTASSNNSGTWTEKLDKNWKQSSDPNSASPNPAGPIGIVDNDFASVAPYNGTGKADTSVQELYNSSNYLPNGDNKWADMPVKVNQKDLIGSTIRHVGVNTIGQSLRNANLQLREEPPNPQDNVSPWLNTTIDRDLTRKPLC